MNSFENYLKSIGEVGHVQSANSVLVYCSGLEGARIGEKVFFEENQMGLVFAIGRELTEVLLLDSINVQLGSVAVRTGETLMVEASGDLLGKVLDPFGVPIEGQSGKGPPEARLAKGGRGQSGKKVSKRYLESPAPPMIDRVRINENLETGVTFVDVLVPVGKGQRQLVIGDQKTGKTNFLIQTIARQVQLGTVCVYVFIGKKKSDLANTIEKIKRFGVLDKTIIIAAPASIPTSLIYLAPFTAFAIAEFFKDQGRDVLVVLDEISRHAKYYRELSILSKKMPGRDGYPGDIFYIHSHLMERAGRFLSEDTGATGDFEDKETLSLKIKGKTASITCLPVVETLNGDFTGYIQTNLMSMTDGHLFFDINAFQEGMRPAVNLNLSVTRVGKQTLATVERDIGLKVRRVLFDYTRARDVAKFGVELLEATQQKIKQGERLMAVFDQESDVVVPKIMQLLFVEMLLLGFWAGVDASVVIGHKTKLLKAYEKGELDRLIGQLKSAFDLGALKRLEETIGKWRPELSAIVK